LLSIFAGSNAIDRLRLSIDHESDVLQQTVIALVMDDVQTLRDLCRKLNASKAVITRALDRLSEPDLVRRKADPLERRSIPIRRTTAGAKLPLSIKRILADTRQAAR
jgi:DNA-binding MarR family transcriptional regulator